MLYKTRSIMKSSFLAVGIMCLLSSTALAQNKLLMLEDEAPVPSNLDINDSGDDLKFSLDDELAPPAETEEPNTTSPSPDLKNKSTTQDPLAPGGLMPKETTAVLGGGTMPAAHDTGNMPSVGNMPQSQPKDQEPQGDAVINAYNNFADEVDRQNFNKSGDTEEASLGDRIMNQVKEDLFSQMADIEKQTSLLTLELKREKIKNEIAAMRAQRQKAAEEELEKQRERERKQAEWEKEQERKLIEDQQKLKAMEIKYEKLRQERVLKAYKESMLKSNQEWVEYNSRLYNQLVKEEKMQNELLSKQKEYFSNLSAAVNRAASAAQLMKEKYNKEVANLQTQVAILKSKLEAEKTAFEESKKTGPNPFALVDDDNAPKKKIAEEYAIMEISGKGNNLVAKLINKNGGTFMVKPGTILNTGHVIEEITQTYITADKSGVKDYLYFSAGGILDKEPSKPLSSATAVETETQDGKPAVTSKIPSLREGMFVE